MTTRTYTDRLADMEYRRSAERASREFEAARREEREIRRERRMFFTGCFLLAATMAGYVVFDRWDRAVNERIERIMQQVEFDAAGYRIFPANFDGRVWLGPSERTGRMARPSLLGK